MRERSEPRGPGVSRRRFVTGALGGAAALGAGAVVGRAAEVAADDAPAPRYLPFAGAHQSGITSPAPASGLMAAFDITARDRDELAEAFAELGTEAEGLMTGRPYPDREEAFPPVHAGTLGKRPPPADLSIVFAVGASLFDERFGLASKRPRALVKMPFLANDRLDPQRSHGDLLISLSADSPDVNLFALRQLMRRTRGAMTLRWMLDGFNRRSQPEPGKAPVRNLMGFRDGTANLDASDPAAMRRYVWVARGDGEPDWAVGGSYQVVRVIRMFVEFWDRTALAEQEAIIGRRKESGAPLDGRRETDVPDYESDPKGERTPLDAHIRLANPRTPDTEGDLILRRGFSYSRGFDGAGRLDQGLAFVSFQRRLQQFLNTQARLAGEPLEEYIQPEGGGFYFALPGVSRGDRLGRGLVGS